MHRRNIAHYGLTTLRSTVAFNMLQLVKPDVGDVIMDPMCGCGALPIEVGIVTSYVVAHFGKEDYRCLPFDRVLSDFQGRIIYAAILTIIRFR
jgi:23S rRNA G2445 N2-methylase RlmL